MIPSLEIQIDITQDAFTNSTGDLKKALGLALDYMKGQLANKKEEVKDIKEKITKEENK